MRSAKRYARANRPTVRLISFVNKALELEG